MRGDPPGRVHVLQPVVVAGAGRQARVTVRVGAAHCGGAEAGDERRVEPRPRPGFGVGPVEMESQVLQLRSGFPGEVHRPVSTRGREGQESHRGRGVQGLRELRSAAERDGAGRGTSRCRGRDAITETAREGVDEERGSSARVGHARRCGKDLAFAVAARIRPRRVLEELDPVRAGGHVEAEMNGQRARGGVDCQDPGEVQAAVRAPVGIEEVVEGHAVLVQIDAQTAVRIDRVAQDRVARAGGGREVDAGLADDVPGVVEGDEVARTRRNASDGVVRRRVVDTHARVRIGNGGGARGVGPDLVPLHEGARGPGVLDPHAFSTVAGDHVARTRCGTADHGVRVGGQVHRNALVGVAQVQGAGHVECRCSCPGRGCSLPLQPLP